jgi:hypothetical protein
MMPTAMNASTEVASVQAAAEEILDHLVALDARVIVVATDPHAQRSLFAASYITKKLHGEGFAWLSTSVNDKVFTLPNGGMIGL